MTVRTISVLISLVALAAILFGMVVVAGSVAPPSADDPWRHVPRPPNPVSHAELLAGPFDDGPSVTKACLSCHPDAATEVMATSHWTWAGEVAADPRTGEPMHIGKVNLQNNFCISIAANWPRCTSCHVGYGWRDETFFETAGLEQVDCLVCHDTSGEYQKDPKGAGDPAKGVDLLVAARSVGRTTRSTCGVCHFKGGGGDGVKHGDLDASMVSPPARVDVHMGKHGLVCADCHRGEKHRIRGRILPPEWSAQTRVQCIDCHTPAPHAEDRLNGHVKTLACQTCHIPQFAEEVGTKMWWDWSKAGIDGDADDVAAHLTREIQTHPASRDGMPLSVVDLFLQVGSNPDVWTHYAKPKGLFLIARRQMPMYRWYDGTTRRYLPGASLPADGDAALNRPNGTARDPQARIWPFKIHLGRQPFDGKDGHLLSPHVFGKGGYWDVFDWDRALREGAKASGVPYSGTFGWRTTSMYWPQNHMVREKSRALRCTDCHGPGGRMPWEDLGYVADPAFQGDRRQMDLVR